jgi:flagellar basal-body rod protein FlgG
MANLALGSAATGLSALNTKLDVIAHNLANVNTTGFKSSRANFEDLMYVEREQPGTENALGDIKPTGLYVGLGVKVSGTEVNFTPGPPVDTGIATDLRIDGTGFFQVQVEDSTAPGGIAYTRAGNFTINADNELVLANSQGRRLEPVIALPADRIGDPTIMSDGRVFVRLPGQSELEEVGQIQLATFANPTGLAQIGENLFAFTAASGPPIVGNPGEESLGTIQAGQLEGSNVDPTRELIELIRTQRAFEMNSQSIRAADEALQTVSQIRR